MSNLIDTFYTAFKDLDADTMCSCYHDDATFYDHGFGHLDVDRVQAMWQMLVSSQRGKDFRITYSDVQVDGTKGFANWEAHYTFTKTGRRVHNIIQAEMEFYEGKIIKHIDHFDLHRWAGQALGLPGKLMGWTPFFKRKLQQQTNAALDEYVQTVR
jgi:ketosteroid isomerase-like protein